MNERWGTFWRARVKPAWRTIGPLVIGALVALVIVLGTIGFTHYRAGEYGVWDALFRAVRLFGFEGLIEGHLPWQLLVAGILGPILTGYAALFALVRLSRDQAKRFSIRLFTRDHVVIAGLGMPGARVAQALASHHARVVGIELDETAVQASGAEERGIPVLVANATDPEVLIGAGVPKARTLLVACGDDATNIDVALAARRLCEARRHALTIFTELEDLALWRKLTAEAIAGAHRGVRLEFFNIAITATQLLLDRQPAFGEEATSAHVGIVGLEELGQNLLLEMARLWRGGAHPGRLRVTITGPAVDERARELVARHPLLPAICELEVRPAEVGSAPLESCEVLRGTTGPERIYICLPRPADVLSVTLGLHRRPEFDGVTLVAVLPEAGSGAGRALQAGDKGLAPIEVFGVLDSALDPTLLLNGMNETIARAKHADYVSAELAAGVTPEENDSLVPWEQLPESLKESNRKFADGVGGTLRAAGCTLVPSPLVDPDGPLLELSDEEVDELARREHDRWVHDLISDGWRHTTGPKDPARKLHPLLVPWGALDEKEREKDRDPMRLLPKMLARAGLEMRRVEDDRARRPRSLTPSGA